MNKPLKDIGLSALLGAVSYALFLCMLYSNANLLGGAVRTVGMAFATVPLLYAGLAFGYTGIVVSFIGAALSASFGSAEYFDIFKNYYTLIEMLPATVLIIAGLPVKGKQITLGGLSTILSITVVFVIGCACFIVNRNILSAYNYDETTDVSTFLVSVFEKTQIGQGLKNSSSGDTIFKVVKALMPILPALAGILIISRIMLNAYFGLEAAFKTKKCLRKKEEYLSFKVPSAAVIVTLACLITALFTAGLKRYVNYNLALITAVPLALEGMVFFHNFTKDRKYGRVMLVLFYVIILITDIWGYIATAVLGTYDWTVKNKLIGKVKI